MHLVVVAIVLVTCLLGTGSSQLDCAFPTEDDIRGIIANSYVSGENPVAPTVILVQRPDEPYPFHPVCLGHSMQRNRYRAISVVVEYYCRGDLTCTDERRTEQFETECDSVGKIWTNNILDINGADTRTEFPSADFTTTLRNDCSFCASPDIASQSNAPASDATTHCLACNTLCSGEDAIARRCFAFGSDACCQLYVNDTCADNCPDDGVYSVSTDFECLRICPDSLGSVANGIVDYTRGLEQQGYSQGTEASVVCDDRYETDADGALCNSNGAWNSTLQNCSVIECGQVPTLENGKVTVSPGNTEVGAVATYQCDTDYQFKDERNTRTCQSDKTWSNEDLECIKPDPVCPEGCSTCSEVDGKVPCTQCEDSRVLNADDNTCSDRATGGGGDGPCGKDNIICIIIPIAIILAIILAVAVAAAVYAYYRWKQAPATKLKEKDPEGINGVARDNPLYLDPTTVAEEVEG